MLNSASIEIGSEETTK